MQLFETVEHRNNATRADRLAVMELNFLVGGRRMEQNVDAALHVFMSSLLGDTGADSCRNDLV